MLENKNLFYEINEILKPDNCEGKLVALGYRAGLGKKRIFTEIMLSSVEVNNSETLLFLFEPPINGALNRILMGSSLFDERLQKIHIDYTPDPDINYIEKTISQFENLNAVFIDCINLINDFQTGKQAEILSRLKEVCKKKNIHIVYAFRLATRMKTYCKVRPTIEDIDEIICDYADAIFVLYRYCIYICDDPIVEYRMMENMHGSLMEIPIYSDDTNLLSYCNKESLPDNAPIKRVELSVQTKMSNDISTISVRDAFDFAIKNNHKAIAFTNYNNVQDFPEIQSIAKEHSELKVIYGTTLLYENDNGGPMAITLLIKNQQGVKNLYKIISSMSETFFDTGIVHINSIERYRENLLCGATGDLSDLFLALKEKKSQSQILSIAKKYDYFVLYPTDDLNTRSIYQQIVELGKKLHIPVIASGDCHYYYKKDEICICVVKGICEINDQQYLRNTEEMLKAFGFLGDEDAYEVVVKNTNLIADSIDNVIPLRDDSPTFDMPNADSCILTESTKKAASIYGTVLPDIIQNRSL